MKLAKQFVKEISQYKTIYCLISGGYHSSASALKLKDLGFESVILLHNKTYLEMKSSIETMKKVQKITQYPYIETMPDFKEGENVWDIIKKSLRQIPKMRMDKKNGKYGHSNIICCNILKHNPARKFYKTIDKENSVIISSICRFESDRRFQWLNQYKKEETYLHFHKKNGGIWQAYPFRDFTIEKPIKRYLDKKGFQDIKHSGCSICPILIIFDMYKETRYYNTLKAMARAGMPCFQKTIQDFLDK